MKVILLLVASIASGSEFVTRNQTISVGTLAACATADLVSTSYALQRGGIEGNPLMRANPVTVKSLVLGSWLGIQWLGRKKLNRKVVIGMNYTMSAVWCGAAIWNTTVER